MLNGEVWQDFKSLAGFVLNPPRGELPDEVGSVRGRYRYAWQLREISKHLDCPHTQGEVLACIRSILALDDSVPGCIVEAGCYQGGSTAKFSLAVAAVRRQLTIFDSFAGLPCHDENHDVNIFGNPVTFVEGEYCGHIDEVRGNINRFGAPDVCHLVPGWFEESMTGFNQAIAVIYLDVDLASSTRTCLRHLYPLLSAGGTLFSQDGHLPLVLEVFDDTRFWEREVGCAKPTVHGLGHSKLLKIVKPRA